MDVAVLVRTFFLRGRMPRAGFLIWDGYAPESSANFPTFYRGVVYGVGRAGVNFLRTVDVVIQFHIVRDVGRIAPCIFPSELGFARCVCWGKGGEVTGGVGGVTPLVFPFGSSVRSSAAIEASVAASICGGGGVDAACCIPYVDYLFCVMRSMVRACTDCSRCTSP